MTMTASNGQPPGSGSSATTLKPGGCVLSHWLGLALLLVALGAMTLRVPHLAERPMHNDEAVNAIKLQALWEAGTYRYDPQEYHGPVLYYATLPVIWLSGAKDFAHLTEQTLRLVPVLFGAGLILLLWLMADGLGRAGAIFAGILTALSPAMVFYSRYFIHEMLLVFFTMLLLAAGWRYVQTRRMGWAVLGGAAVGFMHATKETFVIPLAAMAGAAVLTIAWTVWRERSSGGSPAALNAGMSQAGSKPGLRPQESETSTVSPALPGWRGHLAGVCNWKHGLAALLVGGLVSVLFFSSLFTNPSGPLQSVRAFSTYLHRAQGGSAHLHPWHFYLERLLWFHQGRGPVWTEAAILVLAVIGFIAALRNGKLAHGHGSLICFLGFYTALLAGAASLIPYKTPWCLLGFWHGTILLAGVGVVVLLHWPKRRWLQAAVSAMLVCAAAHLLWQAWQTSFPLSADARNPYSYSPTSPDILELVEKIQALAKVHPQGEAMPVKVLAPDNDYWPLPWYLRQLTQMDWHDLLPSAPVVLVGAKRPAGLEEKLANTHLMTGIFSLRAHVFFELYVEADLWDRYLATKPRPNPTP